MQDVPYDIWPEVGVQYDPNWSFEFRLKHRIRRGLENCINYGHVSPRLVDQDTAEILFGKIITLPEILQLLRDDSLQSIAATENNRL